MNRLSMDFLCGCSADMSETDSSIFDTVEAAINDIAEGKLVIVTDDENRENEGDFIMAASKATPETVNMMIRYGSGVVCVPMIEHACQRLSINPMVPNNREMYRTDYGISVDAASGVTTGISAYDRALTIRLLAATDSTADQFVRPGHVFPLRSRPGGVLERAGHTEAAVDLALMAGLEPAGVLCEIVNDDGTMARVDDLLVYKKKFGLKMISVAQLIEYRLQRESLLRKLESYPCKLVVGDFQMHVFASILDGRKMFALTQGELSGDQATLVRVQRSRIPEDIFPVAGKEHGWTIERALSRIVKEKAGVLLYIEQPDFHKSSVQKSTTAADPSKGFEIEGGMDRRSRGLGIQVLRELGINKVRLMSDSSPRRSQLDAFGIDVVEVIPSGNV